MRRLVLLQINGGQNCGYHQHNHERRIAPVTGVPAKCEIGHLRGLNEERAVLCEIDRIQIDARRYGAHEGKQSNRLRNTQRHHDRKYDYADRDNRACAGHRCEDDGCHDIQKRNSDDRLVAAKLNRLANQRGSDSGIHQDSSEPCAPAYIYQCSAPAFRSRLINSVQNINQFSGCSVRKRMRSAEL